MDQNGQKKGSKWYTFCKKKVYFNPRHLKNDHFVRSAQEHVLDVTTEAETDFPYIFTLLCSVCCPLGRGVWGETLVRTPPLGKMFGPPPLGTEKWVTPKWSPIAPKPVQTGPNPCQSVPNRVKPRNRRHLGHPLPTPQMGPFRPIP